MNASLSVEKSLIVVFLTAFLLSCGSSGGSDDDGDDDDSGGNCDVVANANGPAFFKVENELDTGLSWTLPAFAFGADMKPDECTIFGLPAAQYTVELEQCNIGNAACTSSFGPVKMIVFTVADGETFELEVTDSTFN